MFIVTEYAALKNSHLPRLNLKYYSLEALRYSQSPLINVYITKVCTLEPL